MKKKKKKRKLQSLEGPDCSPKGQRSLPSVEHGVDRVLQRSLPKGQNKTEGGGLLVFSARSLCSHACFTPDFLGELRLYSPLGCVDTGSLSVCSSHRSGVFRPVIRGWLGHDIAEEYRAAVTSCTAKRTRPFVVFLTRCLPTHQQTGGQVDGQTCLHQLVQWLIYFKSVID